MVTWPGGAEIAVEDTILKAIHEAFPAGTPPERPVTAHRCEECDEVDRLLGGRPWLEVADDFPQYCHDTYPLLTAAAKMYYLPAYMCHEVQTPGSIAGVSLQGALEGGEFTREAFTLGQRMAILQWAARYYRDEPDGRPPDALVAYWEGDE
jgi:hypothetical protein